MFEAPRHIQQNLRAIDPVLFAVWNPKKGRWQIREWIVPYPTNWDIRNYDLWLRKSSLCHTICERDDMYRDIGYRPLDNRAIEAILRSKVFSENADVESRKIDEENEQMFLKAEQETKDIAKDCAKRLYHYWQEPTVYMGVK